MPSLVHWAAQRLPRSAWVVNAFYLCWNWQLGCKRTTGALPSPGPWHAHLTTEVTSC